MVAREKITIYGWDNSHVEVPIPKQSYWFTKGHGLRCVVGCNNPPRIVHMTNKGLANIQYCETHAELRIYHSLVRGFKEQGMWCECVKGKLRILPIYKDIINSLLENSKNKFYIEKIKRMDKSFKEFKKCLV